MKKQLFSCLTIILFTSSILCAQNHGQILLPIIASNNPLITYVNVPIDSITYSAQKSTSISKNRKMLTLIGDVKFQCSSFDLKADEVIFDTEAKIVSAKNYEICDSHSKHSKKGDYGKFRIEQSVN